jgi:hypothetical protein
MQRQLHLALKKSDSKQIARVNLRIGLVSEQCGADVSLERVEVE